MILQTLFPPFAVTDEQIRFNYIINMNSQKSLQSVDSTGIKQEEESLQSKSPERWRHLEAKYLKYIALLKSKADKSKKKLNMNNKYAQLVYCVKQKLRGKLMDAFKSIQFFERQAKVQASKTRQTQNNKQRDKKIEGKNVSQFGKRIQSVLDKHRRSAFLKLKQTFLSKQKQQQNKLLKASEPKCTLPKNHKHTLILQHLQKLQSTIHIHPQYPADKQLLILKTQNSRLKQEMKQLDTKIKQLNKQLQSTQQRMEMQLLKKSLALMESQVDSQQKEELIKQYQIQLQCRLNTNNRVLLFTLEDFEIERRRLELINEKLYKQFQNTKETFVEEIKNQNIVINELKAKLGRASLSLSQTNVELESLRAYRFESQYEKECEKYKELTRFNSSPRLSLCNIKQKNSFTMDILKYIQSLVSKQLPDTNISQNLTKSQSLILQSIQQKLASTIPPTTIKNRLIKLNSLERSIAFQQNVKVSNEQLHSFLDIFDMQHQPPNTSIDMRLQQQLQNKVLSLNERLLNIRHLVLSLLQSIQIKNPTKQLLNLIQHINDIFQFSEAEKQSLYGGRKSILQRIFS